MEICVVMLALQIQLPTVDAASTYAVPVVYKKYISFHHLLGEPAPTMKTAL